MCSKETKQYLLNIANRIEKFIKTSNKHKINAHINGNFLYLKTISLQGLSNDDIQSLFQTMFNLQELKFTF